MIRRKVLSLLLTAALLFSSCGVPNYFDYTTDVSFKTQNISQADGRAAIYLDPSILDRIYDGALTPIPTTPKIYLLYSISGSADSSSSSLISAFNSAYRSSINSYPSEYEDFITRNVAPSAGADTVQYALYPFKYINEEGMEAQLNAAAVITAFSADGSYEISVTRTPLANGEFVLTFNAPGYEPIQLYRYNGKAFQNGINNYETDSDDEFNEYSGDASASSIVSPQIKVYLASSVGFRSYTNFMFAKMIEIATFSI